MEHLFMTTTTNPEPDENIEQDPVTAIKQRVIPRLSVLGVESLTVRYSGSGDEGSIEGFEVRPSRITLPLELEKEIDALTSDLLYSKHGSWGNDEGASGTLVLNVPECKLINDHAWYYTETQHETSEF
jgi:hypothetical protein